MAKLQFIGLDPVCGVEIHDNEHEDEGSAGGGTIQQNPGASVMGFEWIFLGTFALNPNFSNFPFAFSQIKR